MPTTCPTPAKVRFATQEAAHASATRFIKTLTAYHCECDWWHLTSKTQPPTPTPDITVTQQVTVLDDAEFAALVSAELRDQATPQQAAALRDRINLDRWINTLADTNEDIQQQLTLRKGERGPAATEWRRRLLTIQRNLRDRRNEAKQLRHQAHLAIGRERALHATEGKSLNELRALAGERAVQRLIDQHRAEFTELLIEEYGRDGLEVPTRIARHAARHAVTASA